MIYYPALLLYIIMLSFCIFVYPYFICHWDLQILNYNMSSVAVLGLKNVCSIIALGLRLLYVL